MGVYWNHLTRFSSPYSDVEASGTAGGALSNNLKQLHSLIRNALLFPGIYQHDDMCHLNVQLANTIADICKLPGLSHFLLPQSFSDLQEAASGGPVVIVNASRRGCDALIILVDGDPVHIPLQITKERIQAMSLELYTLTMLAKQENVTTSVARILRELWKDVVSPIVKSLQTIHGVSRPESRVWWYPVAEFSLLPLHAAGPYRKGQPNFSDLYISSYTSTLATLIHAQKHEPSNPVYGDVNFVAIGRGLANAAVGKGEPHSVSVELANIGHCVQNLTMFKRIDIPRPLHPIASMAVELKRAEWVHLAFYGLGRLPQPSAPMPASLFGDEVLVLERIISQCEPRHSEFAYLSACHTIMHEEECPEEGIRQTTSALMQLAGFRSMIETVWAIDDSWSKDITSMVYDNMVDKSGRLDHTRAAFALHKTMQALMDAPLDQRILYRHIGV